MHRTANRHPNYDRYDRLLRTVSSPSRYAGGEFRATAPDAPAPRLRVLIAHPDLYETTFAGPGREMIHALFPADDGFQVEHVCLPAADMERALAAHELPLPSLDSRTPISEFDLVHFVVPDAACFVNLAAMLVLGGITAVAEERGDSEPLVTASGPPLLAPEAVAPLLDLVLVGEVEDSLMTLAERWPALRAAGLSRRDLALELARIVDGAYAPGGYRVDEATTSVFAPVEPGLPAVIHPARVHDLERTPIPAHPALPGLRGADTAIHLEIRRGLDPGAARAGDAAVTPAAARCRSVATLLEAFEIQFTATGLETIVLHADRPEAHPELAALIQGLRVRLPDLPTRIVVPDLPLAAWRRLFPEPGSLTPGTGGRGSSAGLAAREATPALARRLGLTSGPASLVAEAESLFRSGYEAISAEAVIGVPDESDAEVEAIGRLARDLSGARRPVDRRFGRIELHCRAWVPRPHTDDERGALITEEAFAAKIGLVRRGLGRRREVRLRVSPFDRIRVEALLARGDRSLAPTLVAAAREGIRLYPDTPAEPTVPIADRFLTIANLTPQEAHAEIPEEAPLPWSHICPDRPGVDVGAREG